MTFKFNYNVFFKKSLALILIGLASGCVTPPEQMANLLKFPTDLPKENTYIVSYDRKWISSSTDYDWISSAVGAAVAGAYAGNAQTSLSLLGNQSGPSPIKNHKIFSNLSEIDVAKIYEEQGEQLFDKKFAKFTKESTDFTMISPHINLRTEDSNLIYQCDISAKRYVNGREIYSNTYLNKYSKTIKNGASTAASIEDFNINAIECFRSVTRAFKRHQSGELITAARAGKFKYGVALYNKDHGQKNRYYEDGNEIYAIWSDRSVEVLSKTDIYSLLVEKDN